MRKLAARFVPAADEVWSLQHAQTAEGELFRKLAERGHFGRTEPSDTRQGTYAAAPSGVLLASANTNDPEEMAEMLRKALEAWDALPEGKRLLPDGEAARVAEGRRPSDLYPEGGLVLHVTVRDLPRGSPPAEDDWRQKAWNQDYAWFRRDEARTFLPGEPKAGDRHAVPGSLLRRLARCHLVDQVRGESSPFDVGEVEKAELTAEVLKASEGLVTLRLKGAARTSAEGLWPVSGEGDTARASPQRRGVEVRLSGRAVFNLKTGRFASFELLAIGTRWGGTQYNERQDDLGEAPIGFALTLAGEGERVAPNVLYEYGWEEEAP